MATSKKTTRKKLAPVVRGIAETKNYPILLGKVKVSIQAEQYATLHGQQGTVGG